MATIGRANFFVTIRERLVSLFCCKRGWECYVCLVGAMVATDKGDGPPNLGVLKMAYGNFSWGGVEIDFDVVPESVQAFLMQKGLIHKLSNEVAAAKIKAEESFKPTFDGEVFDGEAFSLDQRKAVIARCLDGTIVTRITGPRGSTLENIAWELAEKRAEDTLAPKGYWPKGDRKKGIKPEDATIEFVGQHMTRKDLTQMVYDKYEDELMEAAKVERDRRLEEAKVRKANAVKTAAKVDVSVEDLI